MLIELKDSHGTEVMINTEHIVSTYVDINNGKKQYLFELSNDTVIRLDADVFKKFKDCLYKNNLYGLIE
jgi:hypothetical protein